MRKIKKLIAVFLAIIMVLSLSMPVMASETESTIPEHATRHTIEVTLEPGEDLANNEAAPYIWGNPSYGNIGAGTVTYTPQMNIPDRYFAFESYALDANGNATSGSYGVTLMIAAAISVAGFSGDVDGSVKKVDWITISDTTCSDYHFKIANNTSSTIVVYLTYYSWA